MSDKAVQNTDIDAIASKYSAFKKGYLKDEYLELMIQGLQSSDSRLIHKFEAKLPLINRGTYLRHYAMDHLVECFLKKYADAANCQIVSLGAGSDTKPFRLLKQFPNLIYHEVDFPSSMARKRRILNKYQVFLEGVAPSRYLQHGLDLRKITTDSLALTNCPTLILSECCLCYLAPEDATRVIDSIATSVSSLDIILYEPISRNDQFGKVMTSNLAQRGIALPTMLQYPTIESQQERLEKWFHKVSVADVKFIHNKWLQSDEQTRIHSLEVLDEREELYLLLEHYCVAFTCGNFPSQV